MHAALTFSDTACVCGALSRLFVDWSLSEKLRLAPSPANTNSTAQDCYSSSHADADCRYVVETPLCSKNLPPTLEQIVQNLGLAVEEDEPDNGPSPANTTIQ